MCMDNHTKLLLWVSVLAKMKLCAYLYKQFNEGITPLGFIYFFLGFFLVPQGIVITQAISK